MSFKTTKTLSIVLGAAFATTLAASNIANAAEAGANPFAMSNIEGGYQVAAEGKCGGNMAAPKEMEGKCGDSMKTTEGKCGDSKKAEEGKKAKKDGKCGTGKCGANKGKKMDGNCGAAMKGKDKSMDGKCGAGMKDQAAPMGKPMEGKCGGK